MQVSDFYLRLSWTLADILSGKGDTKKEAREDLINKHFSQYFESA